MRARPRRVPVSQYIYPPDIVSRGMKYPKYKVSGLGIFYPLTNLGARRRLDSRRLIAEGGFRSPEPDRSLGLNQQDDEEQQIQYSR